MNARPCDLARISAASRPQRMAALSRLPVFLALDGRRAVVAGGTPAAAWKAELLSAAGASVDVYAVSASDELLAVAAGPSRGSVAMHRREWDPADLRGCALAIGACETEDDAQVFAAAARAAGVPVNVIDRPGFCDFSFGSIVNRSPLVIGISTSGAAPVFSQAVRAKIETLLPRGFARWAAAASRWRHALKDAGLTFAGRRKFWQLFAAHAVIHADGEPEKADFASLLAEVRGRGSAIEKGSVMLVAAGPGDPELLTLRAVRALQSADVILFDDLVSADVLDFARREAMKMPIGKHACRGGDINGLMISLARSGKRVIRLVADNSLLSGGASEETAACEAAGIAVDIVPGIATNGATGNRAMRLPDRKRA